MTKRYPVFLLLIMLAAGSCKTERERKDLLIRKWQEVSAQNPQFDEVMQSQQQFMDTVGMHTTAEENLAAYGTANIDSFRRNMQMHMDSFKKMQQLNIASTQFDFRENGIVYIHTNIGLDTNSWKLEEDGTTLILENQKLKGAGNPLQVQITHLSDTSLTLKFTGNNSASTHNFVPVKK